jgi:HD-GYP domain-containing protein (c-di-GMP phosphodiesterase class II)
VADDGGPHRVPSALAAAIGERHRPTYEHCERVAGLCRELGLALGLSERELGWLHVASVLHDVGKISIPDDVLWCPRGFTDAERAIMQTHVIRGERIVHAASFDDGALIALAVRHHHERMDGLGYPDGLTGDDIPFASRIIAVADAYDAMAGHRAYGAARTHRQIMDEIRRCEGRQHDPFIVAKFSALIARSPFRAPDE